MLRTGLVLSLICIAMNAQAAPQRNAAPAGEDYQRIAQEPGTVIFTPPKGWYLADSDQLPPQVNVMVIGKGSKEFPPSINLSTEEFEGTLKEYLEIIKEINNSQGSDWKKLGTISTGAGEASLSQADALTEWGKIRMMHAILLSNGVIYILTGAALQEEFPRFHPSFFEAFRSLRINVDSGS